MLSDFPCPYNPAVKYGAGSAVEEPTVKSVVQGIEYMKSLSAEEYAAYCEHAEKAAEVYSFEELTKQLLAVIKGE